jgi:hypothetical protein
MPFSSLPIHISKLIKDSTRTGSSVICNPPVLDTDEDWLILTENLKLLIGELVSEGWDTETKSNYGSSEFYSLKKYKNARLINFIVMDNVLRYNAMCKATKVATELNLRNKEDRIELFRIFIDAYEASSE